MNNYLREINITGFNNSPNIRVVLNILSIDTITIEYDSPFHIIVVGFNDGQDLDLFKSTELNSCNYVFNQLVEKLDIKRIKIIDKR